MWCALLAGWVRLLHEEHVPEQRAVIHQGDYGQLANVEGKGAWLLVLFGLLIGEGRG